MAEREVRRAGLTAGSGLVLGLLVGTIFFDNPAFGMIYGLLIGAAVAGGRRRRAASRP